MVESLKGCKSLGVSAQVSVSCETVSCKTFFLSCFRDYGFQEWLLDDEEKRGRTEISVSPFSPQSFLFCGQGSATDQTDAARSLISLNVLPISSVLTTISIKPAWASNTSAGMAFFTSGSRI